MTEQPDTTAIRAYWGHGGRYIPDHISALCDALDAARAERDRLATMDVNGAGSIIAAYARAETALELCDALDAARAELKVVKDFKDYMLAHDPGPFVTELEERAAELTEQRNTWRERAQEQEARAEAAEARIAAAMAIDDDGELTRGDRIKAMRRALTGDTT